MRSISRFIAFSIAALTLFLLPLSSTTEAAEAQTTSGNTSAQLSSGSTTIQLNSANNIPGSAPYRYEVVAPTTAYVNEAIDVTIRVLDRSGAVIPVYRGTVIFSTTDLKALLPFQSQGYTFRSEDRGEKVFSKGVTFKNAGSFDLTVSDVNDDVEGTVRIKVDTRDGQNTGTSTDTISILTPENNSAQPGDSITITGKTRKNSKVAIFLNNTDAGSVISDTDGAFIKTVSGLNEKTYILQAKLYDANNVVLATSSETKFNLANDLPLFYGIAFTSGNTAEASSPLEVTVDAEPSLSEVSILLDNGSTVLKQSTPGKYTGKTVAPTLSGSYDITVNLKNTLGQTLKKEKAATLIVTSKAVTMAKFQNLKAEVLPGTGGKINLSFSLDAPLSTLNTFQILYGESQDAMTKEVITFSSGKIMKPDGSFSWYIPGFDGKKWYFKIQALDKDNSIITGVASEVISVGDVNCTIGNITGISLETMSNKSTLKWDALADAQSYNVYKKSADGTMSLVQNVKDPTYTIYLSPGDVRYDDFGVRALCKDGKTESPDVTLAQKVQTGPGLLIVLFLLAGLTGLFIMRREYFMIGR